MTTHRPRPASRPHRSSRALATALAAGTLLATAACSGGQEAPAARESAAAPAHHLERGPSPSPSSRLTEEGARNALITEADIEEQWQKSQAPPQSWRDSLLLGEVDAAQFVTGRSDAKECQRLVDALYDDTLLGKPSGPTALAGFEQGDSRLLYQVAGYDKKTLDASMKWLASLPETCDTFTVTGGKGGRRTVEVTETSLPDEGDARQGLKVQLKGENEGTPLTLTLDVAAVRVGTDAFTVMNGGLDGADAPTTKNAVQHGTQRLEEVQADHTPAPTPSEIE
ncbi:hypothetical protein [Streptomyces albidoflavus]|uniref:hypothetical protein n=1 Tax=Streptomyces albidoflavus TaxID=1886 RepID=UPI0010222207|nr:hypothetical protein [Streptomyces albidoflavus]RZF08784.1 hypothetical protein C0R05_08415 [Streptomyces albidoflavus]